MTKSSKSVTNEDVLEGLLPVTSPVEATNTRAREYNKFSPEIFMVVLGRVAAGEALVAVCKESGMPSRHAFYDWVAADEELRSKYTTALELRAEVLAERAIETADETYMGGEPSVFNARQRLRVDTAKWACATLSPKKYGPKQQIGGADDLPPVRILSASLTPDEMYAKMINREGVLG